MNDEKEQDEIPIPLPLFEEKPHPFLRGLLVFIAVGLLAGGVLLQKRMFKRRAGNRIDRSLPRVKLNPPPAEAFAWLGDYDPANSIVSRIPPPSGLRRVATGLNSFGDWLRFLPLKPGRQEVLLHNGKPKHNQNAHFAIIDIDTGSGDLQQCADAVIRLRAEYLFSAGRAEDIRFNFTSGHACCWDKWVAGQRPLVEGDKVTWTTIAVQPDRSHANFRKYLDTVFAYASTRSLAKEMTPVKSIGDMRIGDVFIHPGSGGHAVIIVDMVEHPSTGRRGFMLAQSFMPAQDMHILVNPADTKAGPWYPAPSEKDTDTSLRTPEWTFPFSELMRFGKND